jgi:hypothetical protein
MAEKRESNIKGIDMANGKDFSALRVKLDLDCSEALKGLKAVTREAKRATAALDEFEKTKEPKLLVIELDSEESTPRVYHEGKEITGKIIINFHWETKRHNTSGNLGYNVEFYETEKNEMPIQKGFALNR